MPVPVLVEIPFWYVRRETFKDPGWPPHNRDSTVTITGQLFTHHLSVPLLYFAKLFIGFKTSKLKGRAHDEIHNYIHMRSKMLIIVKIFPKSWLLQEQATLANYGLHKVKSLEAK